MAEEGESKSFLILNILYKGNNSNSLVSVRFDDFYADMKFFSPAHFILYFLFHSMPWHAHYFLRYVFLCVFPPPGATQPPTHRATQPHTNLMK